MTRFINNSFFRPEVFLSNLPFWEVQINGYPVLVIFWNLFLAVVAVWQTYYLLLLFQKKNRNYFSIILISFFWLLFTPNTTYLLTDARHIIGFCPPSEFANVCADNAWMTIFFFVFAAGGWLTFVWCLRPVRNLIRTLYGYTSALIFILAIIPLMALGVLLGLVNRWNSWEIFTDPLGILYTIFIYFTDLTYLQNWLIISVLFYILYFSGEKFFTKLNWEKK